MLKKLFILPIKGYQKFLSPMFGKNCRFEPTCSYYAVGCIEKFGVVRGLWLSVKRISRCHPWGGEGEDSIPD